MRDGKISRFRMNYDELLERASERAIEFPPLPPTGIVHEGTRIVLRHITKFKGRSISITRIRRGLARRFAVVGAQRDFEVMINGDPISTEDRDLKSLLERDVDGNRYVWKYDNEEIKPQTGWIVSGWIGALKRTTRDLDGIDRGVALMARGKLVQEPFLFEAGVGQQFALSYLIGELHVEFVDEAEDTIGTSRNSLVWDTEANIALKEWGQGEVNRIAREWAERRRKDNQQQLKENSLYVKFRQQAEETGNRRALKLADRLVRQVIDRNPTAAAEEIEPVIQTSLDFLEFDAFWEIAKDLAKTEFEDTEKLLNLFREWEIVEAKEMARVTQGRITTIEKLQNLIEKNAMEVPTLHNFLKEFPWVIDPRWTLVDDEVSYSKLLDKEFPKRDDVPEINRRIDFLCVREGTHLVVVEIKRPQSKASVKELEQIEEYVNFMRDHAGKVSDPDSNYKEVIGYLLCGELVAHYRVREKTRNLSSAHIYVKRYTELLGSVERMHKEFLDRYNQLQEAKKKASNNSGYLTGSGPSLSLT